MIKFIVIFKNDDMCEKYLLFGQSFVLHHCLLILTPLAASLYYFSMQAQQGSHEEQGDGHYTRIFSSATLLWYLMAMQLEVPGSTSLYNDGKGIKVTVSFQPLLPPLKPGEKQCKNAKPKAINHIIYIHEEQGLSEFLDTVIDDIDKSSHLAFSMVNQSGLLDTDSFTLEYTTNHSDSKDIPIWNIADYKALIDEITTLNRAAASFKLLITEWNVSFEGSTGVCVD